MPQTYSNHIRFNPLHHFFITPITLLILVLSVIHFLNHVESEWRLALIILLMAIMLIFIALIARLYALKLQDRIIRLEMRQRYFELTGESFSEKEKQLRMGQIIALRFAGNDELLALIDRAIQESLTNKQIKQTILSWKEDRYRV
jgi:hypothetical protein